MGATVRSGDTRRERVMKSLPLIVIAVILSVGNSTVFAVSHSGTMTGYAYGNATGASGAPLDQGHFANHSPANCPGDPAASWPFGTFITMLSPTNVGPMHGSAGNTFFLASLQLEDTGDPTCSEGNFWADAYFGRNSPDNTCNCPGSPSPGVCNLNTAANNCNDAMVWGAPFVTYDGP